ncbi:MAG: hypothetical protein Q8920_15185, partial [Bacillota bacterium]|nr:hypothetical protein [Bacillota bacterium]
MKHKLHNIIYSVFLLLGIAGVIDTITLVLTVGGINAGTLLPGIVGAAMAVVGFIKLFIIPNSHIIRTKWLRKTLLGL